MDNLRGPSNLCAWTKATTQAVVQNIFNGTCLPDLAEKPLWFPPSCRSLFCSKATPPLLHHRWQLFLTQNLSSSNEPLTTFRWLFGVRYRSTANRNRTYCCCSLRRFFHIAGSGCKNWARSRKCKGLMHRHKSVAISVRALLLWRGLQALRSFSFERTGVSCGYPMHAETAYSWHACASYFRVRISRWWSPPRSKLSSEVTHTCLRWLRGNHTFEILSGSPNLMLVPMVFFQWFRGLFVVFWVLTKLEVLKTQNGMFFEFSCKKFKMTNSKFLTKVSVLCRTFKVSIIFGQGCAMMIFIRRAFRKSGCCVHMWYWVAEIKILIFGGFVSKCISVYLEKEIFGLEEINCVGCKGNWLQKIPTVSFFCAEGGELKSKFEIQILLKKRVIFWTCFLFVLLLWNGHFVVCLVWGRKWATCQKCVLEKKPSNRGGPPAPGPPPNSLSLSLSHTHTHTHSNTVCGSGHS